VYPVCSVVNLNCLVVFATIGVPHGGPSAVLDHPVGKLDDPRKGRTVRAKARMVQPCPGASIC
jgi:hypothetical protein